MTEPFDTNALADVGWQGLVNPTPSDAMLKADSPALSNFARLGGIKAVREAVDRLYLLIFNDDELVPYFEGKDMPLLKSPMASLLTRVLGGPDGYAGRDLAAVHQKLGITDEHFYQVADYLLNVLLNMGAHGNVVTAVSLTMAGVKEQIVQQDIAGQSDAPEQKSVAATGAAATPTADSTYAGRSAPADEVARRTPGEEDGVVSSAHDPTPDARKGA